MGDPKFPPHEQQEHDHACRGQPHYRVGGPSPGGPLSYGQEHRTEADYEEACSRPVDGFEAAVTPEGRKDLRRQPDSYQTDGKVNVEDGLPAEMGDQKTTQGGADGRTLGGFLVTHFGWEAIFYVNLPVGLVAVGLAAKILPPLRSHRTLEPIDWTGAGFLMIGLSSVLLAITQGSTWGWTSYTIMGLAVLGAAGASVFVWWELRARY